MKNWLIFITLLLSKIPTFACGYSPYGEDIRFVFLKPEYFGYKDFNAFNYNANLFGMNNF